METSALALEILHFVQNDRIGTVRVILSVSEESLPYGCAVH